jgi:hypothetical protein
MHLDKKGYYNANLSDDIDLPDNMILFNGLFDNVDLSNDANFSDDADASDLHLKMSNLCVVLS